MLRLRLSNLRLQIVWLRILRLRVLSLFVFVCAHACVFIYVLLGVRLRDDGVGGLKLVSDDWWKEMRLWLLMYEGVILVFKINFSKY